MNRKQKLMRKVQLDLFNMWGSQKESHTEKKTFDCQNNTNFEKKLYGKESQCE